MKVHTAWDGELRVEAARLLKHLARHPFDVEAARQAGLVHAELERRGLVCLWKRAEAEARAGLPGGRAA
jgi:hypothetical protein